MSGAVGPHAGRTGLPYVALDRDGTLIAERHYLRDPDEVCLLPGAAEAVRALRDLGLPVVVVTNQSGVGRGYFDMARVDAIHARLLALLAASGAAVDGIFVCPHHPEELCRCRKPAPGLIEQASALLGPGARPLAVVGDKACDVDLARAVGAVSVLVRTGHGSAQVEAVNARADHVVADLLAAARVIARTFAALGR